ncbi:MAG: M56 family metallopeptidase [Jiangellaceae bacterium]
MRPSLLLLAYAAMLATVGAGLLRRARWPERAPRLGILGWHVLTASIVASLVLAGLALTVPTLPVASGVADFLRACVMMVQAQYATPGGAAIASTGLVLALAVAGRVGYCIARAWRAAALDRRHQLEVLALVGRTEDGVGATIVDHEIAEVYCLPGRRGRIVLTTGALAALDARQLAAVLAHERAHLRARHDLAIAVASALADAFPRVPAFARAHEQVRRLIELAADDTAARNGDRLTLAEGILTVAAGRTPAASLGAGGSTVAVRVRRLLAPPRRLGALRAAMIATGLGALLAVPLWLAAAPAVAAETAYCPLPPAGQSVPPPSAS